MRTKSITGIYIQIIDDVITVLESTASMTRTRSTRSTKARHSLASPLSLTSFFHPRGAPKDSELEHCCWCAFGNCMPLWCLSQLRTACSVAVHAKLWWTNFAWHVFNLWYNADVCACRRTRFVLAEDRARHIDIRVVYRCECSLQWWKSLWSLFSGSHGRFSKRCVGCSNAGGRVVLGRTFLLSSKGRFDILEKLGKIERPS